jgi:hypothetical protein
MAAPERFAEMPDFSLAPRASSIHGTFQVNPKRQHNDGKSTDEEDSLNLVDYGKD